ncbi:MAG: polyphosphate kinase 2 [Deltaproteobacteria bacterium]|nr:MAG: polyphosphate kinase 2 [Deltaproteobacteria bacterium]
MTDRSQLPMEASLTEAQLFELDALQTELVQLQHAMSEDGRRLVILFEGRDTAGKGGAILRFMRYLNPRQARTVALSKPSDRERGEWYFQRYIRHLPTSGEMVLFDRSWYNRAVVEPGLGFCTDAEYEQFLDQVPVFEGMLAAEGITLIKLWFSISKQTQQERLDARRFDPRKQWKLSPVDQMAQDHWERFTELKEAMYQRTSTPDAPWFIVKGEDKYLARTEAMRHVLHVMGCESTHRLTPDPAVLARYA